MKPSVQHSQRGVASHEARHEQNGRGVRLMPGMQKGRIADQAGELDIGSLTRMDVLKGDPAAVVRRSFATATERWV